MCFPERQASSLALPSPTTARHCAPTKFSAVMPTVQPSREAWPTTWSNVWIDCGRRIRGIASISSPRSNNFIANTWERSFSNRSRSALSLVQSVIAFSRLQPSRHSPGNRGTAPQALTRLRPAASATLSRGAGEGLRGERLVITGREAGGVSGDAVEGRLQRAGEMAAHQVVERGFGIEPAFMAQPFEPARADRDMADLVLVNPLENGGAVGIAGAFEAADHLRGDVEAARFQRQWHDREPRQQILGGRRGRFPQPVMRRQIAISPAERGQAIGEQGKMLRLLRRDFSPVVEEFPRQIRLRKPRDDVPGEVDRVELNMRQRV